MSKPSESATFTQPPTHKESWEEELDLITGIAPEGTLKYDRNKLIKEVVRNAISQDLQRLISQLEKEKYNSPTSYADFESGMERAIDLIKEQSL